MAVVILVVVEQCELLSWFPTALTVIVDVLPALLGAFTTTDTIWLIESDTPVCGTGFVTLTIVQVPLGDPGDAVAVTVNDAAYAGESL
jgi:uncharacterized membrane protein